MQVVDQSGAQVLAHGRGAAAEADVLRAGSGARLLERRLDAVGHEVERGAALHLDGLVRVVGEHEHRVVVRRFGPPPAAPLLARHRSPGPADGPEHVAPHHGGADALEATGREAVVDALGAAGLADDLVPRAGLEHPLVQALAADAERFLQALVGTGDVAVERHGQAVDSEL